MDRRARTIALVLLAAQAVAVGVGAYVYAWYGNSVEGSGRWLASKKHLERRVMGSTSFANSCHTLSDEQLDLGRWFGFQEVLLREPVAARTVEYDFRPSQGAYLAFLFGLGPQGCSGLRLSTDPLFPAGRFTADAAGEFGEFVPMPELGVTADVWAHLALTFGPEGAMASLNGGPELRIGAAPSGPQRFGFRSGFHSVVLDDIRVSCPGEGGFHESFFNAAGFRRGLSALVVLLALDFVVWRLVRRWRAGGVRLRAVLVGGAATLLFATLAAFLLQRAKAGLYPRLDRTAEAAWMDEEVRTITEQIRARHGRPAPEKTRVLVVGTSQTWGAGATHADEGFVEVLERLLQGAEPGRGWECVNAGISALRAPRLLELLGEQWLALEPDVLVLNLSNNDKDAVAFEEALHGFARLAAEHGIATLFALEANSSEQTPGELPLHATMRRVAEAHGIPVVDVHHALIAQVQRGFLWWDFVHPTTFGHRKIAEALLPAVLERSATL